MIYRIAGHHYTLIIIALSIMTGIAGVMTEQVKFLIDNAHLNFIPGEIQLEGNIVILVAAFGVFLEHRGYLLEKMYPGGAPDTVGQFDDYSHHIGVMFILVAIAMEALDLLFLAFNKWGFTSPVLQFSEIAVLFVANVMAFAMLIHFGLKTLRHEQG